ncbi:MAG: hypothetical protein R3Y58_04940 [Eubacteriales bacterium]
MISEKLSSYLNSDCYFARIKRDSTQEAYCKKLCRDIIEEIKNTTIEEFVKFGSENPDKIINSSNIPQISSIDNGTTGLLKILMSLENYGVSFYDIGKSMLGEGKKDGAYIKYGENHAKLARELDLVYIESQDKSYVYLTILGEQLLEYQADEVKEIVAKLMLFIPIIKYLMKNDFLNQEQIVREIENFLAASTALRRASSVKAILKYISDTNSLNY